jgi:hypothetical protein
VIKMDEFDRMYNEELQSREELMRYMEQEIEQMAKSSIQGGGQDGDVFINYNEINYNEININYNDVDVSISNGGDVGGTGAAEAAADAENAIEAASDIISIIIL